MTTAPGWYFAEGDPPETQRYWDGTQWVGAPQYNQGQAAADSAAPASPGQASTTAAQAGASVPFQPSEIVRVRRPAEPLDRVGARIADLVIIFGFLIVLVLTDLGGTPDAALVETSDFSFRWNDRAFDTRLEFAIFAIFGFAWTTGWIHLVGATPGKLMLQLRVADEDSAQMPPELQQAAIRASVYLLPLLGLISVTLGVWGQRAGFAIGFVSLVLLFSDHKHRTVMDRIAKTVVVKK